MSIIRNRILAHRRQSFILNYNKKTALNAAIVVSFILAFVMLSSSLYFISLDKSSGVRFVELFSLRSIVTLLVNSLVLYFLFRMQFWLISKYPANRAKVWTIILISFAVIVILSPIISRMQWWWFKGSVSAKMYSTLHYVKDVVVLIISFLFTALIYLINQNQQKVTENQSLEIENLHNKYNALKNQIDPHFLFNSLNTLSGLIDLENEKAHNYVEQLSSVFRYTMQDKTTTTLADELHFAESYIYLMKIRYNEALTMHVSIYPQMRNCTVVPFALQTLIENAVKHNVITRKNPLCVTIETTGHSTVRVENNLQPKQNVRHSSGIGLVNLNERYRLLFGKEIAIEKTETHFAVEVPLIEEKKKNNTEIKK